MRPTDPTAAAPEALAAVHWAADTEPKDTAAGIVKVDIATADTVLAAVAADIAVVKDIAVAAVAAADIADLAPEQELLHRLQRKPLPK